MKAFKFMCSLFFLVSVFSSSAYSSLMIEDSSVSDDDEDVNPEDMNAGPDVPDQATLQNSRPEVQYNIQEQMTPEGEFFGVDPNEEY